MSDVKTLAVGAVYTVPAKSPVTVTRPDGTTTTVVPSGGTARHALTQPGPYSFQVGKSKKLHQVEAV